MSKLTRDSLSFLKAVLQMDPANRLSATEALNHPYFEECKPRPRVKSSKKLLENSENFTIGLSPLMANMPPNLDRFDFQRQQLKSQCNRGADHPGPQQPAAPHMEPRNAKSRGDKRKEKKPKNKANEDDYKHRK